MRKLTKHEAQNLASHLVTGDMIDQKGPGLVSRAIRWFTDWKNATRGTDRVPNHTATCVFWTDASKVIFQVDSKNGAKPIPAVKWLMKYGSDIRIWRPREPMNGIIFRAMARDLSRVPYEHFWDFLKVAFDRNNSGSARVTCSEFWLRCAKAAGQPDIQHLNCDNVEPDELSDIAEDKKWECLYDSSTPTLQGKCVVAK